MQVSGRENELNGSFRFVVFRRECTAADGSVDCWRTTADGFAYGLAAAMVDYCQSILKLRQENNASVRQFVFEPSFHVVFAFRTSGSRPVVAFSLNKFNRTSWTTTFVN